MSATHFKCRWIRHSCAAHLEVPGRVTPDIYAAAQKLRPGRDCEILRNRFGKQTPKLWMMPAQIVSTTVAVGTDASPQPYHLGNQFFPGPVYDVVIHRHDNAVAAL